MEWPDNLQLSSAAADVGELYVGVEGVVDVCVVDQVQRVAQHVLTEYSKHLAHKPTKQQ